MIQLINIFNYVLFYSIVYLASSIGYYWVCCNVTVNTQCKSYSIIQQRQQFRVVWSRNAMKFDTPPEKLLRIRTLFVPCLLSWSLCVWKLIYEWIMQCFLGIISLRSWIILIFVILFCRKLKIMLISEDTIQHLIWM